MQQRRYQGFSGGASDGSLALSMPDPNQEWFDRFDLLNQLGYTAAEQRFYLLLARLIDAKFPGKLPCTATNLGRLLGVSHVPVVRDWIPRLSPDLVRNITTPQVGCRGGLFLEVHDVREVAARRGLTIAKVDLQSLLFDDETELKVQNSAPSENCNPSYSFRCVAEPAPIADIMRVLAAEVQTRPPPESPRDRLLRLQRELEKYLDDPRYAGDTFAQCLCVVDGPLNEARFADLAQWAGRKGGNRRALFRSQLLKELNIDRFNFAETRRRVVELGISWDPVWSGARARAPPRR
jgi:hypothetical protein